MFCSRELCNVVLWVERYGSMPGVRCRGGRKCLQGDAWGMLCGWEGESCAVWIG